MEIVVILLTILIGCVVCFATVGIILAKLFKPEVDTKAGAEAIQNVVTTILGSLLGFIGGRAAGKLEAINGGAK